MNKFKRNPSQLRRSFVARCVETPFEKWNSTTRESWFQKVIFILLALLVCFCLLARYARTEHKYGAPGKRRPDCQPSTQKGSSLFPFSRHRPFPFRTRGLRTYSVQPIAPTKRQGPSGTSSFVGPRSVPKQRTRCSSTRRVSLGVAACYAKFVCFVCRG